VPHRQENSDAPELDVRLRRNPLTPRERRQRRVVVLSGQTPA